ncbi:MAG: hypothetical protein HZC40_13875 [Chloroflexi bacterium]|nr:hypothetical protein [Chloroflexota bacterium]
MTNEQLIARARELVNAATEKNLKLRVWGGIAVSLACASIETHPNLQRAYDALDFVAPLGEFDALSALLTARGLIAKSRTPAQLVFEKDGAEIRIATLDFRGVGLGSRLGLAAPTLPLTDLLLMTLGRATLTEQDAQDAVALLLDHRVTRGETDDQIDRDYIAKHAARNWALFTTIYDNTVLLEQSLENFLDPEEQQLVWRRIELVQEDLDREPKSFGWMVNQFLRRPSEVPR